jgi:hypothetical protein
MLSSTVGLFRQFDSIKKNYNIGICYVSKKEDDVYYYTTENYISDSIKNNTQKKPQYEIKYYSRLSNVLNYVGGFAKFKLKNSWGLIDKYSNIYLDPIYKEIKDYNDKYAIGYKSKKRFLIIRIRKGGYGFISLSQPNPLVITKFIYTDADNFVNGKAKVKQGNKVFYIDTNGHEINNK